MALARGSGFGIRGKAARPLLLLFVFSMALGSLLVLAATRERSVSLQTVAEVSQWDGQAWKVVDRVRSSPTFNIRATDVAGGTEGRTDFIWNGTSEKGHSIRAGWGGPAQFRFNPATGVIEANVRFDLTIDNKKISAPVKLSTESISSPAGALSGRRATLTNGSLAAEVVGTIVLRERDLIDQADHKDEGKGRGTNQTTAKQERTSDSGAGPGNVLIVIKAAGTANVR